MNKLGQIFMKKFLDRIKKNNSGMSIVTVIVAIAFVAILVSIIMMSSVVNFKMKSVNVYAKDSFYSAEQVVDEINVGLQQMVSDGLSYAYTSVMTQYGVEDMTATDKNNMVRAAYYEYLWEHLGVSVPENANSGYPSFISVLIADMKPLGSL